MRIFNLPFNPTKTLALCLSTLALTACGGVATGYYVPFFANYGTDRDGDGVYTQNWAGQRDCDDTDNSIYDNAPETADDAIDSNCNGSDNT